MINKIVKKKKQCSKCGSIENLPKSDVFKCSNCNYQCVHGSNYYVLKDKYRNQEKIEKLKSKFGIEKANDLSPGLEKIKRAIDNFEEQI